MICRYCKAVISQKALFCSNCGKGQITTIHSQVPGHSSTQSPRNQAATFSPSSPLQNEQQAFIEQEARHKEELARLRDELNRQFAQKYDELSCRLNELEKKIPQSQQNERSERKNFQNAPELVGLSHVEKIFFIILLFSLGAGLLWLLHGLYKGYLIHQSDDLTVASAVLTIFGTIYLAYDVLGRLRRSPLAWIAVYISFLFIGVLILEPVALTAVVTTSLSASQAQTGLGVALFLLLVGGLVAAWSGTLVGIPIAESGTQKFSWKGFWIGGISGCLYWLIFIAVTYGVFYKGSQDKPLSLINLLTTISTGLAIALSGGFRYLIAGSRENAVSKIRLRSKKGCLSGLVVGSVLAVASFWPLVWNNFRSGMSFQENVPYGILFLVLFAIIGGITGTVGRYVFWRMIALKDFAQGAFGLMLIFLAAVLQCIDPLSRILGGK